MPTLQENINQLYEFGKLEFDWDQYKAEPLTKRLLQICTDILRQLQHQPNIAPTAANSILFTFKEKGKNELYIQVFEEDAEVYCKGFIRDHHIQQDNIYKMVDKYFR
jgi:hypothetical protein